MYNNSISLLCFYFVFLICSICALYVFCRVISPRVIKLMVLILSLMILNMTSAYASDVCVRSGATGLGNGSDWTNAYPSLPATLIRGNTYYVATGNYGSYVFDDPSSGTNYITVKKATVADHGISTGWSNSYETGQAVFGSIKFTTSYWVLDGVTGGGPGSWETGHGFKVSSNLGSPVHLIDLTGNISNITLSHIEATNPDGRTSAVETDVIYALGAVSGIKINHCYWHDIASCHLLTRSSQGITIEYSKFSRNGPASNSKHKESWSLSADSNVIMRYNVLEDISNTAFIGNVNGCGVSNNWQIYGNVFVHTGKVSDVAVSALMNLGYSSCMTLSNWKFYNNSVINLNPGGGGNASIRGSGTDGGGNVAYNNIYYHVNANDITYALGFASDYDFFSDNYRIEGCSPPCNINNKNGQLHAQISSGSPFVSWTNGDYRLASQTNAGYILPSPFNTDLSGNNRGADGVWDRGAYEFSGVPGVLPKYPFDIQIK